MRIPKRAVGGMLAVATVAIVLANQQQVGLARDEIVYMQSGARYADWWIAVGQQTSGAGGSALSTDRIASTFGGPNATDNNREHPPLMKTLFGLSHRVLHGLLGVDEVTAFRVPSALLHGLLVLLVFAMVLELWGFSEAVVSALLVMFLPRAVFHAGLACFDAPTMTLWFATVYAYWRCLDGRKWPWQVGAVFGLALATKHTALLLPFALGLHYVIAGVRERGLARALAFRWRVIVSLVVVAPLTLGLVWPWLWLDPVGHVKDWLAFHLEHVNYHFEYLGTNWSAPPFPWHVALVTTLFTVPAATLAAGAIGVAAWIARCRAHADRAGMPGVLLALSAAASIAPFLFGSTPIFGAEKHWMPALPSLCIAGGVGAVWAARTLAALVPHGRIRYATCGAVCAAVVGAAVIETIAAQPYALTWYNAIVGGAPGGADRGMNRQFWGVAARGVLPVLRGDAGTARHPVYSHDASPAWGFYIKRGDLPSTLADSGHEALGIANSHYALVIHERHFNRHDYLIWNAYGTVQPMFVLRAAGVPIVTVYKRPNVRE